MKPFRKRPHQPRRTRPRMELLEDRTLLSVAVVEPFESDLSAYRSALHYIPAADVTEAAAHDGLQGLDKHDGYEWLVSTDPAARVGPGMTVSAWVQFHDTADGRAYFGFGSAPASLTQNSGSGHTLSLVLAPNTHQFMFENHSRLDSFSALGAAVAQDYDPDTWYRVEVVWGAGGALTGNLYDSTGVKLLNRVTATTTAPAGGIAFRAFGSDKYFDSVVVDSDSTATPQDIVDAGGGLDPNWQPTDPPPPLQNGPSDGQTPVPWDYTSMPGTGRDIELQSFDSLQQVSGTGFIDDGTGQLWVVLAGQNVSHNVGTVGVDWGPSFGGAATPMLAQYIFRQLPGDSTQLLGVPADVKHFFAPDVLNPGQSDTYGTGLNWVQDLMTPGSELDPVTGRLHRASYSATMNNDGVDVHHSMTYGQLDHRLRVPVADLDPSQNPAGTRWFLMGNINVEGDQNVANNSRWVEIAPHLNGQTFTFTYPNGSGGQLDFRTIPGLVEGGVGARVTSFTPGGNIFAPVSVAHVSFNIPVDASTFTPDQVAFTAPDGSTIPVSDVQPSDDTGRHFDVTFDALTAVGSYTMVIGPDILDLDGNPMPTPFTGHFAIQGPSVISQTPNGDVAPGVDHITVTFNEPINPDTFTADQVVSFVGPDGDIAVNSVTAVDRTNTRFEIAFDQQTSIGAYTMVLSGDIQDFAGNTVGTPYSARFSISSELIVNGGFETGSFSGWTTNIHSATSVGTSPNAPHSGQYAAQLGAVGSDDSFWQDLNTTPGAMYHISFWYFRQGGTPADLHVSWGGTEIYGEVTSQAHGYVQHTFDLMATGTTTRLLFAARNDPSYDALDDVSVTPTAAPGPGVGRRLGDATLARVPLAPASVAPLPPADRVPFKPAEAQRVAGLDQYFAAPEKTSEPPIPLAAQADREAPADLTAGPAPDLLA